MNHTQLWQSIVEHIRPNISLSHFNLYFTKTHPSPIMDNNSIQKLQLLCPNIFVKDYLSKHYQERLTEIATMIMEKDMEIEFLLEKRENKPTNTPDLFSSETETLLAQQQESQLLENAFRRANLRPNYTFENFAVSPSNEVAYAAATAVAKNPGTAYNPLFLYGDVGVGKTHLMQAIGARLLEKNPELKLIYCPGEHFTNEIIDAIRSKRTPQFRNKYRQVDALLIDDIQFIAGKNTVQEEFFHTFNAIQSGGGQVILTSDRTPSEIQLLEDRLRSRFEEGLIIDIQQPNFELRTAILLIKSKQMKINLPMDLAQEIASSISSTRMLQGFLTSLTANTIFKNEPITKEVVFKLLKKETKEEGVIKLGSYVSPKELIRVISKYYDIPTSSLIGSRRSKPIVTPRHYAMYLLKTDLKISLMEIGRIFGGRDHTTVLHAVDKIAQNINKSPELQMEISTLRKQIYG